MELQIIRAQEFIRLGAKGHFDMKASKAVLAQLAAACCKRGIHQALLDLRDLHPGPKPVFSPDDLVTLVNTFHKVGFTHRHRLAVLYGSDPHHRARLFAFIAKMRRWKVQAFDNFEQALLWLAGSGEVPVETEHTPVAKAVPIRQLADVLEEIRPVPQIPVTVKTSRSQERRAGPDRAAKKKSLPSASAPSHTGISVPPGWPAGPLSQGRRGMS